MMIEALESPVIQIDSLKTKFDTTVVSNSLIALLDYSYEEARFLQQLHYWSYSQYGVVIDGVRWIYKSVREWLSEVLAGMSEWKLRKTIASLLSKGLIRREKLFTRHQIQNGDRFWWQPKNQTYYYSIDYEELQELIASAEGSKISQAGLALAPQSVSSDRRKTTRTHLRPRGASFPARTVENVRFEDSTELSVEDIKETKFCGLSQNRSENTNQKKITTKQSDHLNIETQDNIAAALPEINLKRKNYSKNKNPSSQSSATPERKEEKISSPPPGDRKDRSFAQVDFLINKRWKESISDLDAAGIAVNKTLTSLLKMYPKDSVDSAIALLRARKREQHVSNPSGYFVSVLKGDWGSKSLVNSENREVDTQAVFRHWYDLAKELGYCSGQEVRDGEQWVNLGGWERWSSAVGRGYSLDYLKKAIRRNKG